MKIPEDTLGLAAEFAVASELCKRSIYAQLTLGLRKRTDILVETEGGMLRIQVKGKQGREWPFCKGIHGGGIVLIFVDFKDKEENERPDFYILTVEDWKKLLEKELKLMGRLKRSKVTIDDKNIPTWKDKTQGMSIRAEMIKEHKERWDKIKEMIGKAD